MFAVLSRAGCHLQAQPAVGNYALEFLASQDGTDFYVECTATGRPTGEAGADSREQVLLDAIDKVPADPDLLMVRFDARGAGSPTAGNLRRSLSQWVESLDPHEVAEQLNQDKDVVWVWEAEGWSVRFKVLAVAADAETDELGGIGMIGPRIFDHDQPPRLRAAISGKAGKYGDLGSPLVVVTNSTHMQTADDLMTALLGDKLWQLNLETEEFTERRKPNGVFTDARAGRNRDLSAVLHGHFGAANFADAQLVIVHHPFALYPIAQGIFPFAEELYFDVEGGGDMVTKAPTKTVRDFFGLDEDWPFFEDDNPAPEDSTERKTS